MHRRPQWFVSYLAHCSGYGYPSMSDSPEKLIIIIIIIISIFV